MQNERLTILGINPGTRYIGIAVIKGPVLFDWSVKVMSGKRSPAKLSRTVGLIADLIADYQPDVIVLKRLHPSRSSNDLDTLTSQVAELALANSIQLRQYSIHEVESFFAPGEPINRTTLSGLVCERYPELRHELRRERDSLNLYHTRMFEAVALATVAEAAAMDHVLMPRLQQPSTMQLETALPSE